MVRPLLSDADRADVFRGLAHPVRRRILTTLRKGGCTANALRVGLKLSQPAMSQHLRVLREAGLVTHTTDGTHRVYCVKPITIRCAKKWLDQFG